MELVIERVSDDCYYLFKAGMRFGEVRFWVGHEKPMVSFSTPPGLSPAEEEQVRSLPNPHQPT
jgi:hypothetical protein